MSRCEDITDDVSTRSVVMTASGVRARDNVVVWSVRSVRAMRAARARRGVRVIVSVTVRCYADVTITEDVTYDVSARVRTR